MKRISFATLFLYTFISGFIFATATPPANAQNAAEANAEQALPPKTRPLLQEPSEAILVEHAAQALSTWRDFHAYKPTLVLVSQDPLLQQLPDVLQDDISDLLLKGTDQAIADKTSLTATNPLLLPTMAVSASLQAGLFAKVVWVFPSRLSNAQLDIDKFRQQLIEFGAVNSQDAQSFTRSDAGFSGIVRGVPLHAVTVDTLPELTGPVVLHIDLEYFQPLYKGEIKTRLYPLLYNTLKSFKAKEWQTLAATISYSNMNGLLPLTVRFIGPTLASLFKAPDSLERPLPLNWERRAKALYLPNFMQSEAEDNLYLQMQADLPEDASVKYALYQVSRKQKEGDNAFAYLAQAVALDPAYAIEYLSLANEAQEQGLTDQTLRMLQLINQLMPDDPFVSLQLARTYISTGHGNMAVPLLNKLLSLTWSTIYYPGMPQYLQKLLDEAHSSSLPKN